MDTGGFEYGTESDGTFTVDNTVISIESKVTVDEFGVVEFFLRSDGVGCRGLVVMEKAVTANERADAGLSEEESRSRLEAGIAHCDSCADGLAFPVDRIFGNNDTDVGRVEIVSIGQECKLVGRGAFVEEPYTAVEVIETMLGIDTHGARKAKGR